MTIRTAIVGWICVTCLAGCSEDRYTATAMLRVGFEKPTILNQQRESSDKEYAIYKIYKNTQRQLIQSRLVLQAALRKPEVAKLPSVQQATQQGDAVQWLAQHISVTSPDDSEIMTICVAGKDPCEAVALARAVTNAYLQEVVQAEQNQKRQRLNELDRAYVEKEAEVRSRRKELKKLAEQMGTSDSKTLAMKQRLALEELTMYRQELIRVQLKLVILKKDLDMQRTALADVKESDRDVLNQEIHRAEKAIALVAEQKTALQSEVNAKTQAAEKINQSNVDLAMLQEKIKNSMLVLAKMDQERDQLKIACRAAPRVTLLQQAEMPEESAKPSK